MITRALAELLFEFQQGDVGEKALSFLLGLHTLDVYEKRMTTKRGFDVIIAREGCLSLNEERGFFRTPYFAVKAGFMGKKEGKGNKEHVVIIRPNFNEVDENGRNFYREWRSFGGENFHETRWFFAGDHTTVTTEEQHVLMLPKVPIS